MLGDTKRLNTENGELVKDEVMWICQHPGCPMLYDNLSDALICKWMHTKGLTVDDIENCTKEEEIRYANDCEVFVGGELLRMEFQEGGKSAN